MTIGLKNDIGRRIAEVRSGVKNIKNYLKRNMAALPECIGK